MYNLLLHIPIFVNTPSSLTLVSKNNMLHADVPDKSVFNQDMNSPKNNEGVY